MSLEDKLNKNFEDFDNSIISLYGKLAEFYQNKTGRDKEDLSVGFFVSSFACFGANFANTGSYWNGVNAVLAGSLVILPYKISHLKAKSKGEVTWPRLGYEHYFFPLALGYSFSYILITAAQFITGAFTGNSSFYFTGIDDLSRDLGAISFFSGVYFLRSSPGPPPPRRKRKPWRERVKEGLEKLLPKPVVEPVPSKVAGYGRTAGTV